MKTRVEADNGWGNDILSIQQISKEVRKQRWVIGALAVAVVLSSVAGMAGSNTKPLLLDTSTGNVITEYKQVLAGYTVEERTLLAKLAYEGLRRRTGISAVDAQSLNDWKGNITANGYNAWKNLGKRWTDPHFVQPGFSRTLQVTNVKADSKNPYAFIIEAIESDAEVGKPLSNKSFRVRLTLFFTDPTVENVMKIDGVDIHEEELVK